jgi:heme O synthase-like polyprenyltransferase
MIPWPENPTYQKFLSVSMALFAMALLVPGEFGATLAQLSGCTLMSWLVYHLATKRNRNAPLWATWGFMLGVLTLVVLLIAGDKSTGGA